eukprot:gene17895-biopygen39100
MASIQWGGVHFRAGRVGDCFIFNRVSIDNADDVSVWVPESSTVGITDKCAYCKQRITHHSADRVSIDNADDVSIWIPESSTVGITHKCAYCKQRITHHSADRVSIDNADDVSVWVPESSTVGITYKCAYCKQWITHHSADRVSIDNADDVSVWITESSTVGITHKTDSGWFWGVRELKTSPASLMAQTPYSVIVEGGTGHGLKVEGHRSMTFFGHLSADPKKPTGLRSSRAGKVSERKLADHAAGSVLTPGARLPDPSRTSAAPVTPSNSLIPLHSTFPTKRSPQPFRIDQHKAWSIYVPGDCASTAPASRSSRARWPTECARLCSQGRSRAPPTTTTQGPILRDGWGAVGGRSTFLPALFIGWMVGNPSGSIRGAGV